jgi:hypothetical protein
MLDAEIHISVDVAMPAPFGLRYVCDSGPAIRRRRSGKGFLYLDAKGKRVANADTLKRIRSLVIPPALAAREGLGDGRASLGADADPRRQ